MIDPNRESRYWGGNLRRFEIYRIGRERFSQLVQNLNPHQLGDLRIVHQNVEAKSNIMVGGGTIISLGTAVISGLSRDPENAVAFAIFSLAGAGLGAVGAYYRAAAREGLGIISRRFGRNI